MSFRQEDQAAVQVLARDRAAGLAAIGKICAWYADDGWKTPFAESWGDADNRLLAQPDVLDAMKALLREGTDKVRPGSRVTKSSR